MKASLPGLPQASGTRGFDYDPLRGFLTQERWTPDRGVVQAGDYAFDGVGNLPGGAPLFAYDGAGNPTTYKGVTCSYDAQNHLTSCGTALTACGLQQIARKPLWSSFSKHRLAKRVTWREIDTIGVRRRSVWCVRWDHLL